MLWRQLNATRYWYIAFLVGNAGLLRFNNYTLHTSIAHPSHPCEDRSLRPQPTWTLELLKRAHYTIAWPLIAALLAPAALAASNSDCETALKKRDLVGAKSICTQALASQKAAAGGNASAQLETLARAHDNLGSLSMLSQQYREAETHYRASLAVRTRAYGKNHHNLSRSIVPLAESLVRLNQPGDAEKLLLQTLQLRQQALGKNSEAVARIHGTLATFYIRTNQMAKAQRQLAEQISILELLYPTGATATAKAYNSLAVVRKKEGQFPQAEAYFRRSIEIYERKNAANTLEVSAPLLNLATQLTETNKLNEVEPLLLRVKRIRQQLEGEESVGVADIHNRLGVLFNLLGMKQDAEEQLRAGLAIREKRLGANHMLVAESCNNLGMLLMQANRFNEALAVLRHATVVIHSQTGPQSAQTIAAWEQLEKLYGRMIQQNNSAG
ncbi:MAG: tetratricopeptide repeat protein [Pseudomonas sp.]|nr:tetratricopeptide repeat protein [Pseudomonas sp.]